MGAPRRAPIFLFRIASAAAASLAFLLAACETNQIKPPVDTNAVIWTQITHPGTIYYPVYPDWHDSTIAFSYYQPFSHSFHLGRVNLDGSKRILYSELGATIDVGPRWVNDSVLIYSSNKNAGHFDIWYRNINTETERLLTVFPEDEFGPAQRPGLPSYAYTEGGTYPGFRGRITLLPDTTDPDPATRIYLTPDTLLAGEPDWNPSGNRICFSASDPYGARNIWLMTLSGTSIVSTRRLTTEGVHDQSPRFSPDGTKILFLSDRSGRSGIWWVSPDSIAMKPRLIAFADVGNQILFPTWSLDGNSILLSSGPTNENPDVSSKRALYILSNLTF